MNEFEKMSTSELEKKKTELKELLEEVEEERIIVLGQENLHLMAAVAKNYEEEVLELQSNIELIEKLLHKAPE